MSGPYPHLLAPGALGEISIKNRLIMAPMSRRDACDAGIPSALTADYYRERATAGLIVTGVVAVAAHGRGTPGAPCLYTPAQSAGWSGVTRAVHQAGGRIVVQLAHAGRLSHPSLQLDNLAPIAPSAVLPEGPVQGKDGLRAPVWPRPIEQTEIAGLIDDYSRAAQLARDAGFDGVEIDAAGGKLLDQFLRPHTNRRSDNYGGSVDNRTRLLREVVEAVTAVVGVGRVGLRLSPVVPLKNSDFVLGGSEDLDTFRTVLGLASVFELAYLAINERPDFDALALRRHYALDNYLAGGGYSFDAAERAIGNGYVYGVGFASAFVDRPALAAELRAGQYRSGSGTSDSIASRELTNHLAQEPNNVAQTF